MLSPQSTSGIPARVCGCMSLKNHRHHEQLWATGGNKIPQSLGTAHWGHSARAGLPPNPRIGTCRSSLPLRFINDRAACVVTCFHWRLPRVNPIRPFFAAKEITGICRRLLTPMHITREWSEGNFKVVCVRQQGIQPIPAKRSGGSAVNDNARIKPGWKLNTLRK